jgi:hypothetical protein
MRLEITERDLLFYSGAVDSLTQRFEIAREFVRHKGLTSLPMEELTNLMIVGIKEWLSGTQGEQWLSTIGYIRVDSVDITYSGAVILSSGSLCPVCSGMYHEMHGMTCECCGKTICGPCASIVDPIYHIGWCSDCLEEKPLTNLLVYSE